MNYYVMATECASEIGMSGAKYDDDKFVLSGDKPSNHAGYTVDLSDRTADDLVELVAIIDRMRVTPPTGILLVIPRWLGLYLYENHEASKPTLYGE